MHAAITNYGGRLVALVIPDKNGNETDIVAGFDSIQGYLEAEEKYFGALIGRYANRIAYGQFLLNGVTYRLYQNLPPHTLHGGNKGFQDVVWEVKSFNENQLQLFHLFADGDEGFPGNLSVFATYELNDQNELSLSVEATCDKDTVFNFTHHPFFNLNGQGSGSILQHQLTINADYYLPIDQVQIPIGEMEKVAGTPFDFITSREIGQELFTAHEQLKRGGGYDHHFVLNNSSSKSIKHAATAIGDLSQIKMKIFTTEPGMQFYGGNFLSGRHSLKNNKRDEKNGSFCLETQHAPDSPNQPNFPTTLLKAKEKYTTQTVYQFS